MIKKTFQTLKENPAIILGFALSMILACLSVLPMIGSTNDMMEVIMEAAQSGVEPSPEFFTNSFMPGYLSSMALMLVLYIIVGFVILPPVLNRVYEACSDRKEDGWIKRGLKRSWWKIVVTAIIMTAALSVVFIVGMIVMFIPIIGQLAYMCAMFAASVFGIIAFTSTIAEDDFGKGLNNIFTVGKKYFFKLLGVMALVSIPIILISIVLTVFMFVNMFSMANVSNPELMFTELFPKIMNITWIFSGIMMLYYVFAYPFIYTYSMHQYLENKESFYYQAPVQSQSNYQNTDF